MYGAREGSVVLPATGVGYMTSSLLVAAIIMITVGVIMVYRQRRSKTRP